MCLILQNKKGQYLIEKFIAKKDLLRRPTSRREQILNYILRKLKIQESYISREGRTGEVKDSQTPKSQEKLKISKSPCSWSASLILVWF